MEQECLQYDSQALDPVSSSSGFGEQVLGQKTLLEHAVGVGTDRNSCEPADELQDNL